ncbi:unnamed protein product [Rhizophagus irregularis]|nr:unnamed protein product [Rhizophagus irregularis]
MQLKINDYDDIVLEWIPYNQFNEIKETGKNGLITVYSAIWKDGPLYKLLDYDNDDYVAYTRYSNKKSKGGFSTVYSAEWKNGPLEYDVDKEIYNRNPNKVIALKCLHNSQSITDKFLNEVKEYSINKSSNILNIYGISQNPDTKEYIMIWDYCGEVDNIDKTKIYGIMPYVAPEVLRGKPYTQAADIYSFGMIMYFVATGRQPFDNRAHDYNLALDICKGIRPEISEPEAPRYYIDLMKKCWDLDKNNRPDIFEEMKKLKIQFKEAEEYRKANLSSTENYQIVAHPQAIYTSRLLNPFTENLPKYDDDYNSQCLDQVI